MEPKQRWLLVWVTVGAVIGLVPALLEHFWGIPCWAGGPVTGATAGAVYQLVRYGL